MERANRLDLKLRGLLEKSLRLSAVLAHDADVVAASLAIPAFGILHVICAELSEAVCREKDLLRGVIRNHNLGPMNHGGCHKN